MNIRKMLAVIKAFRQGAPMGDVAALKIDALRKTPTSIERRLFQLSGSSINLDVDKLKEFPEGSLGREYERHLATNNIEHLRVSPSVVEQLKDNPYAILFAQTHDLHHVLTGFDTSLAGEAGVAAFNVGQGIGPVHERTWDFAKYFYFIAAPSQVKEIRSNLKLGYSMGIKASLLLEIKLEKLLPLSLAEARIKVGINKADVARTRAGGSSILVSWLYSK